MAGDWSRMKKSKRNDVLRFFETVSKVRPVDMLPMDSAKPPPGSKAITGKAFAIVLQLMALVVSLFLIIVISEVPVRIAEASSFVKRCRIRYKMQEQKSEEKTKVEDQHEPKKDSKDIPNNETRPNFINNFMVPWFQQFIVHRPNIIEEKK